MSSGAFNGKLTIVTALGRGERNERMDDGTPAEVGLEQLFTITAESTSSMIFSRSGACFSLRISDGRNTPSEKKNDIKTVEQFLFSARSCAMLFNPSNVKPLGLYVNNYTFYKTGLSI